MLKDRLPKQVIVRVPVLESPHARAREPRTKERFPGRRIAHLGLPFLAIPFGFRGQSDFDSGSSGIILR